LYVALISAISAEDDECLTCGADVKENVSTEDHIFIDILPGICPKVLNVSEQGLLPIAVLGSKDFDSSKMDPNTINLTREGSAGRSGAFRWHYEDVSAPNVSEKGDPCPCYKAQADGYNDLILEFDIYRMAKLLELQGLAGKNISLNLTGSLQGNAGGSLLEGSGCINVSGIV